MALAGFGLACSTKAQSTRDKVQATDTAALDSLDCGCLRRGATAFPGGQTGSQSGGLFSNWFSMVGETQSEPRWVTPLATTPRCEQEFRHDIQTQPHNGGLVTNNFRVSKGLEIKPAKRWEVILALPPYIENNPA